MASQPQNKTKGSSRWGSLLSGAVAGLESRLDTILAEDNEASARSRAQDAPAQDKLQPEKTAALAVPTTSSDASRSPSRSRLNDRLQERLAKAVASQAPSRSQTPVNQTTSPRSSLGSRQSADLPRPLPEKNHEPEPNTSLDVPRIDAPIAVQDGVAEPIPQLSIIDTAPDTTADELPPTLLTSGLPINPARISNDTPTRPSLDLDPASATEASSPPSDELEPKHVSEVEAELAQLRHENAEAEKQRQEEMLANMERIDALQAKLQYLAKETVAAAKQANAGTQPGSLDRKLAEKDERIALLMEEGEKLSKVEMRQGAAIKKIRAKSIQDEKVMADLRKRIARLEDSETDLKQKLKHAEQSEKQGAERLKRFSNLERDLEARDSELTRSNATVASLRNQLVEAEKRAEEAETKAKDYVVQADTNKLSAIQEQLEDAKLEKRLADDKWTAEVRRVNEEAERQKQQSSFREAELTNEISVSSSDAVKHITSDTHACRRILKVV